MINGPWYRDGESNDQFRSEIIRNANGFEVANTRSYLVEDHEDVANLVVASPDLLEAVEAALRIAPLWAPGPHCDTDEGDALSMMHKMFTDAVNKAKPKKDNDE